MGEQKQSFLKKNMVTLIILAVSLIAAAIVYQFLPEQVPMQFNLSGGVSRMGSKWEIFIIALLPAVLYWSLRRKYGRK